MTPSQLTRFRAALEKLRAETLEAGPAAIEPNRKDPTTVGVADEDEQALNEMLQTLSSQRNKKRSEMLAQIQRALRKLDESPDDFGLCEECEEEIAPKRLESMPYAAYCAECQSKRDPRRGVARKSVTDYK
jgi:DnaK suppressor protein